MTIDLDKVRQKVQYVRSQMRDLEQFLSMDERTFLEDALRAPAAARMIQVALEASFDLCAHIIAQEGWGLPKSYGEVVLVAVERGLLPPELKDSYLQMARFRDRLVYLCDLVKEGESLQFIKDHLNELAPLITAVVERYLKPPYPDSGRSEHYTEALRQQRCGSQQPNKRDKR
ncbi:MAG: type VII toxin-antitoxin system HepT family RNase toxin [Ignavibacteriales bacterium]